MQEIFGGAPTLVMRCFAPMQDFLVKSSFHCVSDTKSLLVPIPDRTAALDTMVEAGIDFVALKSCITPLAMLSCCFQILARTLPIMTCMNAGVKDGLHCVLHPCEHSADLVLSCWLVNASWPVLWQPTAIAASARELRHSARPL